MATNGLPNGGGPGLVSNGVDQAEPPVSSATTISTVAIQAGKTKIVLAVLKVSCSAIGLFEPCFQRYNALNVRQVRN